MLEFGRDDGDEAPSYVVDVRRHGIVVHDRQLVARLVGRLPTKLHVLRRFVLVAWRRDARLRGDERSEESEGKRGRPESAFHISYFVQKRHRRVPTIVNPAPGLTQTVSFCPVF